MLNFSGEIMAIVLEISTIENCKRILAIKEDASFLFFEAALYHVFNLRDQNYHLFKVLENEYLAPAFDDFQSDGNPDYYVKSLRRDGKSVTEDEKVKAIINLDDFFDYEFYGLDYSLKFNIKRIANREVDFSNHGFNLIEEINDLPKILL